MISSRTLRRIIKTDIRTDKAECHGFKSNFCSRLIIFHNSRKGRIYGYRRLKSAFVSYSKNKGEGYYGHNLTEKQMRKIMKDHNLHGKNRTGLPYKNEKRSTINWTEDMDLIKEKFKMISTPVISMDIKYVKTLEGYLYFNWVKDLKSHAIIGFAYSKNMSYFELAKPSLQRAIELLKSNNIDLNNLIIHSDNGLQYYHQDLIKYAQDNNFRLSKKETLQIRA
ncbi:DDE-type integrase/transposase/recombinase [Spiroplasma eriocheiris]|uniref:Integrase catalytic domain-containing protein n=1 Tax=Spiroplasma eriocheiris TaxID=315358 RepID=A0A0H3XMS7_9MOLU|nr:DDE-type integrase/transposase/recombinase [Spiroplasma eriocheiris]AHF57898.1 hypothetical protein SPE_0776 [Spiroplasma eriocheiris CCTCC M 207170]AKM54342.1 hypothetical protein SERIO_v1c07800 [Spiroplasma eriocheiris]